MISAGTHQPPGSERASSAIVQITLAAKRAQRSAACTLIQRIATVTLTSGRLALRPAHDDAEIATPTVSLVDRFAGEASQCGALAWKAAPAGKGFAEVRVLSPEGDFRAAAANLFRYLRELDGCHLDLIVAEKVPEEGLGSAIMDRLRRAV